MSTVLGYKHTASPPYWFGEIDGRPEKFIRVVVGLAIPTVDRALGAAILLGERYRPSGSQQILGLDAQVNSWPYLENWLCVMRRQTQYGYLVVEHGNDAPMLLLQIEGLSYAIDEIPLIAVDAPKEAGDEIGRQKVDKMIGEGRLVLDRVHKQLQYQQLEAAAAINAGVVWLMHNKAWYEGRRKGTPRYQHTFGEMR